LWEAILLTEASRCPAAVGSRRGFFCGFGRVGCEGWRGMVSY
jgi:hypothetical protein